MLTDFLLLTERFIRCETNHQSYTSFALKMAVRLSRRAVIIQIIVAKTVDNMEKPTMNETDRELIANNYEEFDVSCAINGDMLIREMTFDYSTRLWDPRVMD